MSVGQTSSAPTTLNDESVLQLVARLEAEGRAVDVVRLTEKWGYGRSLPRAAILASSRALLSLRLMDRALARLRALTDANPDDVDALFLTAELMLERGWGSRSQKIQLQLKAIVPKDPRYASLDTLASHSPQKILAEARQTERSGSHSQQLRLAEVYLATGSILRGKNLLERLRRKRPDDERVIQLLWGARGDLKPRPGPLLRLVEELSVKEEVARQEEWGAADNTESMTLSDVTMSGVLPPEPQPSAGFPRLFRRASDGDAETAPSEVTMAVHMASSTEMMDVPQEEVTESSMLEDDPDTKILDIITNRREERSPAEPSRRPAVDLRALHDLADPETDMGGEDDELIVMKARRDAVTSPDAQPSKRRRPIEVIEKHPVPVQGPSKSEVLTPESNSQALLPDSADMLLELELEPVGRGLSPALVICGAALIAGIGVGSVYWGMRIQAGRQVVERTASALATGDFNELSGLELQLSKQVSVGQPPLAERASALATIQAVLWSEYTGNLEYRDKARLSLETAADAGASPEALTVAQATLALSVGDLSAVEELMATDMSSDEMSYLRVRAALAARDTTAARAAWPSPPPAGERYAVLDAVLAGEADYRIGTDNLDVTIFAHEQRWGELQAPARLQAVAALLKASSQMSPRQRARLYAVSAELNGELGRENLSRISWGKALEQSPAHPDYLYEVSSREIATGASQTAAERLSSCVSVFPAASSCRRAHVAALLELDRLDEATAAAGDDPLLSAWVQVIRGELVQIPQDTGPSGLSDYLTGLQAAASGDTDTVESSMSLAQVALGTNPEPELRYLSLRALAVLVEHGSPRLASRRARELQTMGSADPNIYVRLSRYYQSNRRRIDASQYQSHATMLTREWDSGLASYTLGALYAEAGQDEDAQVLWRQYLALEPSGTRADRAASALQP